MCELASTFSVVQNIAFACFFALLLFLLANKDESYEGRWYEAFIGFFTVIINDRYIKPKARWAQKLFVLCAAIIFVLLLTDFFVACL